MMDNTQQTARRTLELVEAWIPSEEYDHERKFQSELQDYLDKELNNATPGMMGGQREHVVSTEHGRSKGDVVVDDRIGIELKRNLSNDQTRKLDGQIKSYRKEYDYVIVCACGIEDMDGWRRLKNEYTNTFDMMEPNSAPVEFVHKRKSEFGVTEDGGRSRGQSGGTSVGSPAGEEINIEPIIEDGIQGLKTLTSDKETEMSTGEAIVSVLQFGLLAVVFVVILVFLVQILLL